jgi:alpha-maltose-1-phosphate synthase
VRPVLLTREYPPEVYGGAGVHVEYLARELGRLLPLEVRCFGAEREPGEGPPVRAFEPWAGLGGDRQYAAALRVLSVDLAMTEGLEAATLVHSHTWYANFAGHLAKVMFGLPHVVTTHSFEPHRPWKVQQLGEGGYALSSWCERTALEHADAVIAVSGAMRDAVLELYDVDPARIEVIHNGIDPDEFRPDPSTDALPRWGVDPARPYVLFVGRISRQKGIDLLLEAVRSLDPAAQFVLCAGSADTAEQREEVARTVEELQRQRTGVLWLEEMVPRADLIQLITHAAVLAVPSVYEPLGIVNLEAMACETAVVASAVGGIPEVVVDGETGLLVPYDPNDPAGFTAALAARMNELVADPGRARELGVAGRRRVLEEFTWRSIAERTAALYERAGG